MLLSAYIFVNFCILKTIFHTPICYWLHNPYVTCSYNEARERSPWAGHPPLPPTNDHKTFASNKYNHRMDQPLGLEKITAGALHNKTQNIQLEQNYTQLYFLYNETGHNNLSEIGISLS